MSTVLEGDPGLQLVYPEEILKRYPNGDFCSSDKTIGLGVVSILGDRGSLLLDGGKWGITIVNDSLIVKTRKSLYKEGLAVFNLGVEGMSNPKDGYFECQLYLPETSIELESDMTHGTDALAQGLARYYSSTDTAWRVSGNKVEYPLFVPRDPRELSRYRFRFRLLRRYSSSDEITS